MRQNIAAARTVATLVIVVVGKHDGLFARQQGRRFAKLLKVGKGLIVENITKRRAVAKLGDIRRALLLRGTDRFAP